MIVSSCVISGAFDGKACYSVMEYPVYRHPATRPVGARMTVEGQGAFARQDQHDIGRGVASVHVRIGVYTPVSAHEGCR